MQIAPNHKFELLGSIMAAPRRTTLTPLFRAADNEVQSIADPKRNEFAHAVIRCHATNKWHREVLTRLVDSILVAKVSRANLYWKNGYHRLDLMYGECRLSTYVAEENRVIVEISKDGHNTYAVYNMDKSFHAIDALIDGAASFTEDHICSA